MAEQNKTGKLLGALTVAALGLASPALADETVGGRVDATVDTTYVYADSVRTKRLNSANSPQEQVIPQPREPLQDQNKKTSGRFGFLFGTGGILYITQDQDFGSPAPDINMGAELRVVGPLYVQGQFLGANGGAVRMLSELECGLEAKLPFLPGFNSVKTLVGTGLIWAYTRDRRYDGRGSYTRGGVEFDFTERGFPDSIRYGVEISKMKTRYDKKGKGAGFFLQFTRKI